MVGKIHSRKVDQAAKPGIAAVHGQCMSVAISWAKKVQLAKCNILVGFPKSSHILQLKAVSYWSLVIRTFTTT